MVKKTGVLIPEEAFEPAEIFAELEKRGIFMHEEINQLDVENESVHATR
jgi:lysine 6-dehydrogenase